MGRLDPKPKFGACYSKRDDDTSARWQLFGLVRKTRNANYARPNGFLTARAIYWYPQSCAPGRSDDLIIINLSDAISESKLSILAEHGPRPTPQLACINPRV